MFHQRQTRRRRAKVPRDQTRASSKGMTPNQAKAKPRRRSREVLVSSKAQRSPTKEPIPHNNRAKAIRVRGVRASHRATRKMLRAPPVAVHRPKDRAANPRARRRVACRLATAPMQTPRNNLKEINPLRSRPGSRAEQLNRKASLQRARLPDQADHRHLRPTAVLPASRAWTRSPAGMW